MSSEKQRKTFLSYSRVNKDFAIRLAKELKAEGFHIWLDLLDIPAGARWDVEVESALEECDIFMIIMTPAAIASENVRDEIGYAIDNSKRFLPVLLEPCNVPLRLRRFQYVDFTNKSFDDGVNSAKDLLRSLIAQPTIPRGVVLADLQAEAERKAKEEAEQAAQQKSEADRRAKEEADRLAAAAQKAEEEKVAKAQSESDRKAKQEADRLAAQKAEEERAAKARADREAKAEEERKAKKEADRLAAQKVEEERVAKARADREAKEEADRLAKQKADAEVAAKARADREAKAEADRLAAQKAEADRLARQKAEEERLAKAKIEADRKAKEEAGRLAAQKAKATPVESMPVSTATTQKKPVSRGLMIGIAAVAVLCVVGLGIGITSLFNPGASATEAPVVDSPATETTAPQRLLTSTPKNTSVPVPTETTAPQRVLTSTPPEPAASKYFTEEFDKDPGSDWRIDILGPGASANKDSVVTGFSNSRMRIDLPEVDLYFYYTFTGFTYDDVRLDLRAENFGVNTNNVSLTCRESDSGWYEWSVGSGGDWYLYAYTDEYHMIGNGGTTFLKQGKTVNEYAMVCAGNTISMFINGQEIRQSPITENTFQLTDGRVGFNISSLNVIPVIVEVDWFKISEP